MFNPIPPAATCAQGWLNAVRHLVSAGDDAYNVIVDINDPTLHGPDDYPIIMSVDAFLKTRGAYPISTVANTIFPKDLYARHGSTAFKDKYLHAYESIRNKGWGRYFERMIRWQSDDGKTVDQLSDLIRKLSEQIRSARQYKHIYEMTLFDPARDRRRERGRQCLSFLSFKLHPTRGLMLTAIYRNHHYIARALGNFIGLGNLMSYIAGEAGTTVGPLTCVSTHAELDTSPKQPAANDDACLGWTITQARELIREIESLRPAPTIRPNFAIPV